MINLPSLISDLNGDDQRAHNLDSSGHENAETKSRSAIWFVPFMFLCLSIWAIFIPPTLPRAYIYTWDSAAYVETARSLHAGRGLQQRVIHGVGQEYWEPIAWWPPGYPILIALVQMTGLSAESAGVAIAIVSAAISVMILAFICLKLMHWTLAIPVTLTTIIMPVFLHISVACMSDATYFALLTASMACLVCWSIRPNPSWILLSAAGFFAGASWTVRNVGLALFVATAIFLAAHLFWMRSREVVKLGAAWLGGVAICSVPLIIRNLITFGGVNSYQMPPSNLSLWTNIRRAGEIVVHDLTQSSLITEFFISKYGLIATMLTIVIALSIWGRKNLPEIRSLIERNKLATLMLSYVVVHISVVIAARTTYRWGELITSRHCVPFYWIMWLGLATYGTALLCRLGLNDRSARIAIMAVIIIAGSLQLKSKLEFLGEPPGRAVSIESELGRKAASFLAGDIGKDQIVLSTRADLLRLHCDVNARKLPLMTQYDYVEPITLEEIRALGDSGFLWGLVIEDVKEARKGAFDHSIKAIVERPEDYPEFERIQIDSPALILKYVGAEHFTNDQIHENAPSEQERIQQEDRNRQMDDLGLTVQFESVLSELLDMPSASDSATSTGLHWIEAATRFKFELPLTCQSSS